MVETKSESSSKPNDQADTVKCDRCGLETNAADGKARLFECSKCNKRFVSASSVCPGCHRFSKRIGDAGCVVCGQGRLIQTGEINRS